MVVVVVAAWSYGAGVVQAIQVAAHQVLLSVLVDKRVEIGVVRVRCRGHSLIVLALSSR